MGMNCLTSQVNSYFGPSK